jgi:hypothetical protein
MPARRNQGDDGVGFPNAMCRVGDRGCPCDDRVAHLRVRMTNPRPTGSFPDPYRARERDGEAFGEGKKEAPAIDEGEEARLCGGLWTNFL